MKPHSVLPCLFLPAWCPPQLDGDLQVVCSDGQQASALPLTDALTRFAGKPVALIVPVEHVSSCAVALPAGSAHWQRQALPYAVEPLLAEEVDGLHLALGTRLADGRHRVVAIKRSLLEGWLTHLRGGGLQLAAIHVDADLLPNDVPSLFWDANRCLLAGTDALRLALPSAQVSLALNQLNTRCRVFFEADAVLLLPPDSEVSLEVIDVPLHAWLVQRRAHALDLAQGAFATKSRTRLRHCKPVVAALVLLLAAQLAFDGMQVWLLNQQAAGYRQVNEAIYRELFPGEQRIVNLKAQFDQHLQQGTSASCFGELLAVIAGAMPSDTAMQLKRLEFQSARAQVTLHLHGGEAAAYEVLQQRLRAARLEVGSKPIDGGAMQLSIGGGQ